MARFKFLLVLLMALALGTTLISCADNDADEFETERDEYRLRLENTGEEIDRQIAELRMEADQTGDEIDEETQQRINDLEEAGDEIDRNLEELGRATKEQWRDMKTGLDRFFDRLDRTFEIRYDEDYD
ncbi:MAG: hypothetical protein WAN36_05270 [Calditrichia bacterium]